MGYNRLYLNVKRAMNSSYYNDRISTTAKDKDDSNKKYTIRAESAFECPPYDAEKLPPIKVDRCFDEVNKRMVYNIEIDMCIDMQKGSIATETTDDKNNKSIAKHEFDPTDKEKVQ